MPGTFHSEEGGAGGHILSHGVGPSYPPFSRLKMLLAFGGGGGGWWGGQVWQRHAPRTPHPQPPKVSWLL